MKNTARIRKRKITTKPLYSTDALMKAYEEVNIDTLVSWDNAQSINTGKRESEDRSKWKLEHVKNITDITPDKTKNRNTLKK